MENTENFLDLAGLQYYTTHIKALLADKLDISDLEDLTLDVIAQATMGSNQITHGSTTVADILDTYLLDLDYSKLAFDVSEIVFESLPPTTAVLGRAIIGKLILGTRDTVVQPSNIELNSTILKQDPVLLAIINKGE